MALAAVGTALLAGCVAAPGAEGAVSIWSDAAAARAVTATPASSGFGVAGQPGELVPAPPSGALRSSGVSSPFGVSRVDAGARRPAPGPIGGGPIAGTSGSGQIDPSGPVAQAPLDASGGALGEQRVDLAAASLRLVDRLVEAGSQRVDEKALPRSLLVWPIRELGTQRHTAATRAATRLASDRARGEYRGMAPATLEGWAQGQGDWAIVAGLRWARLAPEGPPAAMASRAANLRSRLADAQLCGVLVDRRSQRVLARFAQRVDPASLDLAPAPFHADLPIVPQTSGSPLDVGLCGDATALPTVSALVQAIDLELGIQRYEAGDYRLAARAFGRAVDVMGNTDIEALAGLAMALERSQPAQAARVWNRLADASLARGRIALTGPVHRFLASAGADGGRPQASEQARQREARRARLSPEGEGVRARLLRRISVAAAGRVEADGPCALVVAHQDDIEARDSLRAPAYERAYAMARWIALAGALDGRAIEIGNVPVEPAMIGTGTGDIIDAWDRRVDLVLANCRNDAGRR